MVRNSSSLGNGKVPASADWLPKVVNNCTHKPSWQCRSREDTQTAA